MVTILSTIAFLVACNLKNLVELEVNLLESDVVVLEGLDLPTDKIRGWYL